ncbi:SDR family oxidoreductase [Mesorhizobium sp. BHbdii]
MDLGIAGKTALVLGAGGGLGGAIARALAREGAQIACGDIGKEAAQATVEAIRANGGEATAVVWDLADRDAIPRVLSEAAGTFGPIDILVNNTGGPPPTPASGQDASAWLKHFEAMVLSVIALTDAVLPGMRDCQWGRVITSTSSGVLAPIANLGLSNALRLSLVGWSKTLAREVGLDGITCNVVVPGRIATQRIKFLDEQKAKREDRDVESVSSESTASIPLGRYGAPEEYADVVAFLASRRASYITGSVVRVDGGLIQSI